MKTVIFIIFQNDTKGGGKTELTIINKKGGEKSWQI